MQWRVAEESKINNIGGLLSRNSISRCGDSFVTKDVNSCETTQLLDVGDFEH